jgi:hypothetical protein
VLEVAIFGDTLVVVVVMMMMMMRMRMMMRRRIHTIGPFAP